MKRFYQLFFFVNHGSGPPPGQGKYENIRFNPPPNCLRQDSNLKTPLSKLFDPLLTSVSGFVCIKGGILKIDGWT